jgi:hypothetical protein
MSKCHLMKRKVRRRLISRNSKLLDRWKYRYSWVNGACQNCCEVWTDRKLLGWAEGWTVGKTIVMKWLIKRNATSYVEMLAYCMADRMAVDLIGCVDVGINISWHDCCLSWALCKGSKVAEDFSVGWLESRKGENWVESTAVVWIKQLIELGTLGWFESSIVGNDRGLLESCIIMKVFICLNTIIIIAFTTIAIKIVIWQRDR